MNRRLAPGVFIEVPLYAEVRKRILATLQSGEWTPGSRLPTEQQLADRYGVSIGTIRKSVEALVAERILLRQPGRGTFVASHLEDDAFSRYLQFFDEKGRRVAPQARLLAFRHAKASEEVAACLGIAKGAGVIQIENLRIQDGRPCMLDHIFLARETIPALTREVFVARAGSIYGLYQDRGNITVLRVEESLTALAAPAEIACHLELPAGNPALLVRRTAFSFEDRPVEYRHRYVDTTKLAYHNVIGLQTS